MTRTLVRGVIGSSILGAILVLAASSSSAAPTAGKKALAAIFKSEPPQVLQKITERHCPKNMALVGRSCVDMYEGSLVEVHEDGTETDFSPYTSPHGHKVRAVSRPGVVPQAHISMSEAKKACKASGKRLCRAGEWKAACKGPSNTTYPYGNTRIANACIDTNRTSPMSILHRGDRSFKSLNDPRANQQENTVERTGVAASCTNEYGVHDMVGNVHEWTDDGSFRGGFYLDTKMNHQGCDYKTVAHNKDYYDYSTGFRCCANPE